MDADEHDIERGIDQRPVQAGQLGHRGSDEYHDRRRRQSIFDEHGQPGQIAARRAHGLPGKAVAPAGRGDGRAHFGQRQHEREIHHPHQDRRDHETAPAGLPDTEIPAGEITGDHARYAQAGQQHRAGGTGSELALGQV